MSEQPSQEGRKDRGGLLVLRLTALVFVVLGGVALYETLRISERGGLGPTGAAFFPLIISVGMLIFGTIFLLRTTVLPDREIIARAVGKEAATRWTTVGLLAAALLVYVFVLDPLGYVIATGIFVPVVARILGSGHRWRDVAVGFGLAVAVYVGFQFLGVRLPGGVLELLL